MSEETEGELTMKTESGECPACRERRRHDAAELAMYHPLAGHGYAEGQGWSRPDLEAEASKPRPAKLHTYET